MKRTDTAFQIKATALADLKRIAIFTQHRWGKDQRNQYLKQLDQAFHQLAENPSIGTQCDYIRPNYRKLPISSHIIYYKTKEPNQVEIIRILHKHMDVSKAIQ